MVVSTIIAMGRTTSVLSDVDGIRVLPHEQFRLWRKWGQAATTVGRARRSIVWPWAWTWVTVSRAMVLCLARRGRPTGISRVKKTRRTRIRI